MSQKRRYALERPIARGGMGEVYRGVSRGAFGFETRVAMKRLRSARARDYDARIMLQQEAALCATLEHPNVMPVLDLEEDSAGDIWLIMLYNDGVDVHDLLESGPLPIAVVTYIVSSVLNGLAYIHKRGIVHRDITLGNILVSRAGAVRITDFGLATSTELCTLAAVRSGGTAGFMSPEALRNESLDARSDLFSLGAVFYQLLTGIAAFPAKSTRERMAQTLCKTPEPPHVVRPAVPPELSAITMRLLAPDREDRFASALAVLDMLPAPSKYGSEDLATLLDARHKQGRLRLPSMRHEIKSDGADSVDNLGRQKTMPHPGPQIESRARVRLDSAVLAQALAEANALSRQHARHTERAVAPSRPRTNTYPGDRAARKDAAEASKAARDPRRRLHPWWRACFALMALSVIFVWGWLGLHAVRLSSHDPQQHETEPVTPQATEPIERSTEPPVSPGPSKTVTAPVAYSDENNPKVIATRNSANKARSRVPRTRRSHATPSDGLIAHTEINEDEIETMATPLPSTRARAIEDPAAVDPFERFAGTMGATIPGEVVMQP